VPAAVPASKVAAAAELAPGMAGTAAVGTAVWVAKSAFGVSVVAELGLGLVVVAKADARYLVAGVADTAVVTKGSVVLVVERTVDSGSKMTLRGQKLVLGEVEKV
jgi:hypothetical protein